MSKSNTPIPEGVVHEPRLRRREIDFAPSGIGFFIFTFSTLLFRYIVISLFRYQMNKNKQNIQISILSAVALLLLDIATKMWTVYPSYKPIIFVRNFLYLSSPQQNNGVAFGIPLPMWAQVMASIIVLVALALIAKQYIFSINKPQFIKSVLFGIIIGGAIGNLINRVMQGYVVDFIVLRPIPTFNIADMGITVGLIGIFLTTFTDKK